MPRHIAQPLDELTARRALNYSRALAETSEPVTVRYAKRPNREGRVMISTSTGFVHEFVGTPGFDTFSVIIMTQDKGPRTINLCRVKSITKPVE